MSEAKPFVEFQNVHFAYKKHSILENFSFDIAGDQLIGVIGVNGSGKSTLLKLMLGLLRPQQGQVLLQGVPAGDFSTKSWVASALQEVSFPNTEKVEEILSFVGDQFPQHRDLEELIEDFQLQSFRRKACGQLSGGMKRRLALACAFVGSPKVVLLDEPTTGLDQESRQRLLSNLRRYQQQQKALILMISHHPEEVMDDMDQFFHLKKGSIVRLATEDMKKSMQLRKLLFKSPSLEGLPPARLISQQNEGVEVVTEDSDQYLKDLVQNNIPFQDMQIQKLSVEELLGEFL